MRKILLVIISCFLLAGMSVKAQEETCGIHHMTQELLKNATPEQKAKMEAAAKQLDEETAKLEKAIANKSYKATKKIIPVVFHVIHANGTENISDAQMIDAITQMNEDYSAVSATGVHSSFQSIVANVGFEFRIAKIDPNGNPTTGIERFYDPGYSANGSQIAMKQKYMWPQHKYLNIYVVKSSNGSNGSAFSYYPSQVVAPYEYYDGIVASHWAVGRTGTAVSTHYKILSHEAGHWANLIHTWGSAVWKSSAACNDDDQVSDTPNTLGNDGCNINNSTCGSLDNVQNFMEYTDCENMFTLGQNTRMQAALNSTVGRRYEIWQQSNLVATGVVEGGSDTQAPSTPSNVSVTSSTTSSISLSWAASTDNVGVVSYTINNATSNTNFTTSTNSYTITGLAANTNYTFYVNAKDAAGNTSAWSSGVQGTTSGTTTGCTGSYCASKGTSQQYEWITGVTVGNFSNTSASNAGYGDFTNKTINLTAGSSTSITLTPNTTQYTEAFKVWIDYNKDCDFDDAGEQVFSGSAKGNTTGSFTVSSSASGTTRMRVSMSYSTAPSGPCVTIASGEVEDYTVSFGGTPPVDTQAPSTPGNLTAGTASQTSIPLSWAASTDNVGVTAYDIYRGTNTFVGSTSSTSYTATGLTCNTSYNFTVKAKDAAGNVSAASNSVTKSTTACITNDTQAPTTPTNLAVTATTSGSISLSWTASTDNVGVVSYTVNNATSNTNFTATSNTYTVTGLAANTNYTFYVNAKDAAGNTSGWSSGVQGKTTGTTTGCTGNYCVSASNRTQYEYIKEVKVGSFTNTSDAQKYSDFTSKIITITKGQATSITLTPGWPGATYNEYFKMWIDLNADCDFDDAGELVYDAGSAKNTAVTGSITLPTTAFTGNTRMRVSMKYNAGPTQCLNGTAFGDGEVEDYTVNLTASNSGASIEIADISDSNSMNVYPNPSNGSFTVSIRSDQTGTAILRVVGLNGQILAEKAYEKSFETIEIPMDINLSPGIYNLQIIDGNNTNNKRLIIQ